MKNKTPHFKLYYILDEYIEYLRKLDKTVSYNKINTRPYVGENNLPDIILKRTCNFVLLEEKCKEWENIVIT